MVHRYKPADPFTIAEELGARIQWTDLDDDTLGFTQTILNRPVMFLDKSIRQSEKRYFVMAHELGHIVLHADVAGYYKSAYHGDNKAEYEADLFAKELLVFLYDEDHQEAPATYENLVHEYGAPFQ